MKIIDERKPIMSRFKEISVGQVFYVENQQAYGESPYIKICTVEDSNYDLLNALNLEENELYYIGDDEPIIPYNATLTIN